MNLIKVCSRVCRNTSTNSKMITKHKNEEFQHNEKWIVCKLTMAIQKRKDYVKNSSWNLCDSKMLKCFVVSSWEYEYVCGGCHQGKIHAIIFTDKAITIDDECEAYCMHIISIMKQTSKRMNERANEQVKCEVNILL